MQSYEAAFKSASTSGPAEPAGPKVKPHTLADLSGHKSESEQMDNMLAQLGQRVEASTERTQAQIIATTASSVATRESLEAAGIDRQIQGVRAAFQAHQITSQQELQQTEQLLTEKWQSQQSYFNRLRTLYADNQGKLAQLDSQEAREHGVYLTTMQRAQDSYASQVQRSWQGLSSVIGNDMAQSFSRVMQGTETSMQAMAQMFEQLGEKVVTTLIRIEAQRLISHALGLTKNKEEAHSDAAAAAAGAAKSAAQIPYVGWILAPVAAASVYAMASGFSAEGGFDIPAGLNPKVQLHEREMVLPAQHADVIRRLSEGGEGGGGPHIHIHATDSDSFLNLLDRHDGVLRGKISAAVRGRSTWE